MSHDVTPCKRGHTEPRNRFNQCPACLRESRRAYNKRTTATRSGRRLERFLKAGERRA